MHNRYHHFVITLILLSFFNLASSQKIKPGSQRCYTMEAIEQRLATDPLYKARYNEGLKDYILSTQKSETLNTMSYEALGVLVTIPVVVHIILPDPFIITDDDVNFFIKRLNEDFSGLNADSTNAPLFYDRRGHSLIRFAIARRDPQGNFTTGIQRKKSNTPIGNNEPQAIKKSVTGGLNPWPSTDYYNLWIGKGPEGIIGIAPEIGPGSTETDGVCIDYRVFTNNNCYSLNPFSLSRTAVHEIGHNLGLYHIFHGGCNSISDFGQLTTPGLSLPPELLAPMDDTPSQLESTNGCPSGTVSTGCAVSPNPPGKMYQNFMDYTDDACYSLFTKGQVARMHWVILNGRPGYLTSMGHVPPDNAPLDDAELNAVINPGGTENIPGNCISYAMPACPGIITPKVRVTNRGLNPLLNISVAMQLNNDAPFNKLFTTNLAYGESAVLTMDPLLLDYGNNALKFFTFSPNNNTDEQQANDTILKWVEIITPVTNQVNESFETPVFPPAGWTINNPDGKLTWQKTSKSYAGNAGMFFENYNYDAPGQTDDLISMPFMTSSIDSLIVTFNVAHKNYPGATDRLSILVTGDCGATFTTIYNKSGNALSTAGSTTTEYSNPISTDWRQERTAIATSGFSSGQLQFIFRNTNGYGNNIFIDNIQVKPVDLVENDLELLSVKNPAKVICEENLNPQVLLRNAGSANIQSFKIAYQVDNNLLITKEVPGVNLGTGNTLTVDLPATGVTTGQHVLTVFVYDLVTVNSNGDEQTKNDTLSIQFGMAGKITAPLTENFENSLFPPANWVVVNYDNGPTWQHALTGSSGPGSVMMPNYGYTVPGEADEIFTPLLDYQNIDSLFLKFDVAASPNGAGPQDTLEILVSKDCGENFTTVYKKWGSNLQTTTEFQPAAFQPNERQWRTDSINLTTFAKQSPLQIVFRNITNGRNNIFLDDIRVQTIKLPERLKQDGLLLLPNPFKNSFVVWHFNAPTTLKFISVYNATGQLAWKMEFNGNASTHIPIDLTGKPAGLYFVQLGYKAEGNNKILKIIKH